MFGINPFELMIILLVGLIVVGPKRLPEIGRTIGRAFSEIRRVQDEIRDTVRFDLEDDDDEGPPSYPSHRDRVPEEPPGPSAVELASAAARDRDGARDASSEEEPADPWSAAADLDDLASDGDESPSASGRSEDPAGPGANGSARRVIRDEAE
jgi:Tat protein translocase TatB subunit